MGPDALKRMGTKYGTITDHRREKKKKMETWVRFKVIKIKNKKRKKKEKDKRKKKRKKKEMATEPVTKVDLSLLTTC